MATVTLGNIKFNWKGVWNSGTAYVVDDVVSLSGSSYVCIQAGTNQNPASASAYWEQMSSAGTNGTDVGTTITTQGDILYRDGSGLQRLPIGTANQELRVNSGATALEYYTPSGGAILQVKSVQTGDYHATTSTGLGTSGYNVSDLNCTFTPTSASSHILITGMIHAHHVNSYAGRGYISYNHSGISETLIKSSNSHGSSYGCTFRFENGSSATSNLNTPSSINLHLSPNTTNAITFKMYIMTSNSGHKSVINNTEGNNNDSDDGGHTISSLTFWEIAGGISPSVTNSTIST